MVDVDDIVRDLAHDVDLEPVLAAVQPVARQRLDDAPAFLDPPAEWHHDQEVGEPHFIAHPAQRRAFEREPFGIGGVRIARRPAETRPLAFMAYVSKEPGSRREATVSGRAWRM